MGLENNSDHKDARQGGDENSVHRRHVLKSIGASGTAVIGFSGVSQGSDPSANDVTVLSGSRRSEVLSSALSDDRTSQIHDEMGGDTLRPVSEDAICTLVEQPEEGPYRVVVIPFDRDQHDSNAAGLNDDTQVFVRWLDTDRPWTEEKVVGYRMETVKWQNGRPISWNATTYHVDSGDVVSQENNVQVPESSETNGVEPNKIIGSPPPGGCEDGFCLGVESNCGWDWSCVVAIANSHASQFVACSACVANPGPWCLGCLLSVIGVVGSYFCDPNPNCDDLVYSCDPCYCANPIPPGC